MNAAAQHHGPDAHVRRGWDEIRRQYPNEWVVLVDTVQESAVTTAGVVHAHSPSKRTALAAARGLPEAALFWTGAIRHPLLWALGYVDG